MAKVLAAFFLHPYFSAHARTRQYTRTGTVVLMLALPLGLDFGMAQRSRGDTAGTASIYAAGGVAVDALGIERRRARPSEHRKQWMLLPPDAPSWAADPSELWRRAGASERQFNGQEARTLGIALPRELPAALYDEFVRFVFRPFVEDGLPVQVDLHVKPAGDGGLNPHAHSVIATKPLEAQGFAKTKRAARPWNSIFLRRGAGGIRHFIARLMNEFFALHNLKVRVDPRPNRERGLPPPEKSSSRRLVRNPTTESAREILAERDETRVLRLEYREAKEVEERSDEEIAQLIRMIEIAEQGTVRICNSTPIGAGEFLAQCETIASTMDLAFVALGTLCGKVAIGNITIIVHPDRIVLDGDPDDDAVAAVAAMAHSLFRSTEVLGPAGATADRLQRAISRIATAPAPELAESSYADESSVPAAPPPLPLKVRLPEAEAQAFAAASDLAVAEEVDEDAFQMPPPRPVTTGKVWLPPAVREVQERARRENAEIKPRTAAIRARGGLKAVLARGRRPDPLDDQEDHEPLGGKEFDSS